MLPFFTETQKVFLMVLFLLPFFVVSLISLSHKKYLISFFIFSLGANVLFYLDIGSPSYHTNELYWFVYFVLDIWPLINLGLLLWILFRLVKVLQRRFKK